MHELLDVKLWPRALLRYPLLILSAILLGALLAFAYSYAPLHRAKDWKIEYLEQRLEARGEQVRSLEESLAAAQASLEGTPSGEEVGAIRTQLDEATRLADSRKSEIASLEKQLDQTRKSRDQWKSRHEKVLGELEQQKAQSALPGPGGLGDPQATPEPAAGIPAAPAQAAPSRSDATPAPRAEAPPILD